MLGATSTSLNASQHAPLDQGEQGTCVACAFAQALATGIQAKYGLALDKHAIFTQVKALVPCGIGMIRQRLWRNGTQDTRKMVLPSKILPTNVDTMSESTRGKSKFFDAACFEMKMAEYMKMFMKNEN